MAKIDEAVAQAFCSGLNVKTANTTVQDGVVRLWGHKIAYSACRGSRCVVINHCGYVTRTTMQRLNAIVSRYTDNRVHVGIKNGCAEVRYSDGTVKPFEGDYVIYKNVSWVDGTEMFADEVV